MRWEFYTHFLHQTKKEKINFNKNNFCDTLTFLNTEKWGFALSFKPISYNDWSVKNTIEYTACNNNILSLYENFRIRVKCN